MKPDLQTIRDLVQMISNIDDPYSYRLQASRLTPYMVDLLDYVDKLEEVAGAAREVGSYEDFSEPIVSNEYDPTEHNATRLKLHDALDRLDAEAGK